jgi:hypothetical protein
MSERFQFKGKEQKGEFEKRLIDLFGTGGQICASRVTEGGQSLTLYYIKADGVETHVATWSRASAWIFNEQVIADGKASNLKVKLAVERMRKEDPNGY